MHRALCETPIKVEQKMGWHLQKLAHAEALLMKVYYNKYTVNCY